MHSKPGFLCIFMASLYPNFVILYNKHPLLKCCLGFSFWMHPGYSFGFGVSVGDSVPAWLIHMTPWLFPSGVCSIGEGTLHGGENWSRQVFDLWITRRIKTVWDKANGCRKHWVWYSAWYKPGWAVVPEISAFWEVKAGGPEDQDYLYIRSEFKATLSYWRICL